MPAYATASEIINSALQELGMGVVNLNAAANDATGYQMVGLLNALGQELMRTHDWQVAQRTMTFWGDGVSTRFSLPTDFGRQVNQTQWSVSDNRPLIGPVSPQTWSWDQYGIVSAGILFQYRISADSYEVFPTPGAGVEFALYYIIKGWVANPDDFYDLRDTVPAPNWIVIFDKRLMIAGLKLKFWAAKGFDTTVLQREFDFLLQNEKATSQGAPVINLAGGYDTTLIGWGNILDGNWNV